MKYDDAVQAWIRRWLGHEKHQIILHFEQNPLRIYEIWSEETFVGSREVAMKKFRKLYPELASTTDFSPHAKKRKLVRRGSGDSGGGQLPLL